MPAPPDTLRWSRAAGSVRAVLLGAACAASAAAGPSAVGAAAEPPGGAAAGRPGPRAADTVTDVRAVIEEAKDRQRGFERGRRRRLPYGGGRGPDRCDEIVGRYCLWHDDGRGDADRPDEPGSVRAGRDDLLRHLERALREAPRSEWLTGQRIRYLLEAGRDAEALAAATSCRAAPWWCRALEGRVLHEMGRFAEAGDAFGASLEAMSPDRRRRWTDVSLLLEGDASERWEEAGADGRRRLARRLWRLSDPLYLAPGNDRRTEHMARLVAARVRRDAATPFGPHWNDGLRELTVRYGLPTEYRREPPSPAFPTARPSVIGRHPPHALSFLPRPDVLLHPGRVERGNWRLDARRPHASYAPAYADTVTPLRHWLAVFPRGDTSVVVAAYRARSLAAAGRRAASAAGADVGRDEVGDAGRPAGGAGVGDRSRGGAGVRDRSRGGDGGGDRRSAEAAGTEALLRLVPVDGLDAPSPGGASHRRVGVRSGGLAVRVPSRPHVVSVEALRRDAARAERARYAVRLWRRPEGVPGLSDVLILEPEGTAPESVSEALGRVRGPGPVRPGERLRLYWEVYGPRLLLRDVEVSVALAEGDGGLIERLAGALGLGDDEGVALGWRDAAGRPGRVRPRSVELLLPEGLPSGPYRLVVTVRVPGHDPMTARRRIEVAAAETD